jgi:murein DD-endopeptidase MepM/ murein hydrolase activator NlpD
LIRWPVMKKLLFGFVVLLVAALGYLVWSWDATPPLVSWNPPQALGKKGQVTIEAKDSGRGLHSIQVVVRQSTVERVVFSKEYPVHNWPWEKGPDQEIFTLSADQLLGTPPLKQGQFEVEARVSDQANLFFLRRTTAVRHQLEFDTRPPSVGVMSQQHYIRQGGSEAILYRISQDAVRSGVQVGETFFLGYPVTRSTPDTRICIFALAYDQPVDTPMFVWAEDEAGNRAQVNFWKKVFPSAFRQRNMPVTDAFMQAVVPEILAHTDEVSEKGTLLDSYLEINRRLRDLNNDFITAVGKESAPEPIWSKPFLQLTNSKVEAVFADRRTYFYNDKQVDRQTHLGFDLATSALHPVEASNEGIVVFADYLGIYGNCVILDHGLGLMSLYGHLSSIDVEKGARVQIGQSLGRTGQTGLAGGDHLHFSMLLQGVQVNPVEWWDPKWVELHVLAKLSGKVS